MSPDDARRPEGSHDRERLMRSAVERDLARHARRETGPRQFWRSLGLLGVVGWSVTLGAVGGAMAGRFLDRRLESGVRFTLILLCVGTVLGSYAAWQTLKGR